MSATAPAVESRSPAGVLTALSVLVVVFVLWMAWLLPSVVATHRGLWGWYGASLLLGVVAWFVSGRLLSRPGPRSILAVTLMGVTLFVGVAAAIFAV